VRSIKEGIDTGSREGALRVHMLGFAAEIEHGAIEERTRDGLHRALRDGRQPGVVPFGYEVERDAHGRDGFVIVPEEAETWARSSPTSRRALLCIPRPSS
jgi:DNA invertase Pin-like site-specific DNA recombinase